MERASDIKCLYAVGSGEEALLKLPRQLPDVVLMDIQLPGLSGVDCVRILKKNNPSLEIIMLTIYKDTESIFQALEAGANGYLLKGVAPKVLLEAIRDIASGGAPFTSHIARRVVQHFRTDQKKILPDQKLSPRETQVIELLSAGYRYKEIAGELGISLLTVKFHVKRICEKMHVRNRTAAIVKHCLAQPRRDSDSG
jgi:DNA-binding NarL/FixJ family response regulator